MTTLRRFAGATALALALLVSGCANPPGTDGNLVNEWPALAEPAGWMPEVGCQAFDGKPKLLTRVTYAPLACDRAHTHEIFHVGQITGAEANLDTTPATDSITYRKAWAECDTKAIGFFGGQWRDRKVWINVSFPAHMPWTSGAKWFACSMSRIDQINGDLTNGRGSLKDAFASDAALQFDCYQVGEGDNDYHATRCDNPHNAEFVAAYQWDVELTELEKDWGTDNPRYHTGCSRAIDAFVGASVRSGTWVWRPDDADWLAGDRYLRCYLYTGKTTLKRSMKGVGAKGWLK